MARRTPRTTDVPRMVGAAGLEARAACDGWQPRWLEGHRACRRLEKALRRWMPRESHGAGSPRSQSAAGAAAPVWHRAGPRGECDVQPRSSPRPPREGDAAARRKRNVTSARRVVHVARRAERSGSSGFTGPPFPYSRSLTADAVLPAQRSEHAEQCLSRGATGVSRMSA
jgi:hypothetical protein